MKAIPASCCKHCRYYHGANGIVCALHPYGPKAETCIDFEQKSKPTGRWFQFPYGNEKTLIKGIIAFVLGYSFALWWVEVYLPGRTSDLPRSPQESQVDSSW